jgi:hypothetical protein
MSLAKSGIEREVSGGLAPRYSWKLMAPVSTAGQVAVQPRKRTALMPLFSLATGSGIA